MPEGYAVAERPEDVLGEQHDAEVAPAVEDELETAQATTRIYLRSKKVPVVVEGNVEDTTQLISNALRDGETFVGFDSTGHRFNGAVYVLAEEVVGTRENVQVEREATVPSYDYASGSLREDMLS